jgi:hypothetical protein
MSLFTDMNIAQSVDGRIGPERVLFGTRHLGGSTPGSGSAMVEYC